MIIEKEIKQIENLIPQANKIAPNVSARGIDWHLDHSLNVVNQICKVLIKSNPEDYKPKFNFPKSIILLTGYIPRGKGRSPKALNKKEAIDINSFPSLLIETKDNLKAIESLSKHCHFRHPLFGDLKLKEAKKFLQIHTAHHLKIANDILKSSK